MAQHFRLVNYYNLPRLVYGKLCVFSPRGKSITWGCIGNIFVGVDFLEQIQVSIEDPQETMFYNMYIMYIYIHSKYIIGDEIRYCYLLGRRMWVFNLRGMELITPTEILDFG
jgi:hypothetical protein